MLAQINFIASLKHFAPEDLQTRGIAKKLARINAAEVASHLLVHSKKECERIKAEIDSGKDFHDMARRYSECPSSKTSGYLVRVLGIRSEHVTALATLYNSK